MWVNFPPILHYSEGKTESKSDDDRGKMDIESNAREIKEGINHGTC